MKPASGSREREWGEKGERRKKREGERGREREKGERRIDREGERERGRETGGREREVGQRGGDWKV